MAKRRRSALVLVLLALPVLAAKFWETKKFTEWSEKECNELLTKSPWAFKQGFGQFAPAIGQATGTFGERESQVFFHFRLMSAKPVRMALARLQTMKQPSSPAIEQQVQKFVNADPGNEIVIQIDCSADPPSDSGLYDITQYLRSATLATFNTTVFLAAPGKDQIAPTSYIPPGPRNPQGLLVFPRFDASGKPNFTGDDKSISLRGSLRITTKGTAKAFDIFIKMNPKDMQFDGAFAL